RPVGDEAFEVADGQRRALAAEDAGRLALVLLGAHPPGDPRQGIVGQEDTGSPGDVAGLDEAHEAGDVDGHRTAGDTGGDLAGETPPGLEEGEMLGETEGDL